MSMTETIALAVAILLSGNLLLTEFLGAGSAVRKLRGVRSALAMGGSATLLMLLSTPLTWMVDTLLLRTYGLEYLRLLAFVLLIVLVEELLRALLSFSHHMRVANELLPLAAVNSVVLGGALLWAEEGPTIGEAMLTALLGGVAFTLAAVLLASVQGRLTFSNCPKAFRGAPIALVTAGLLAMAFLGFAGVRI